MELLSPGEKVKKLRKELGLKQEDIANDQISKSLVSMIEKNRRALTWTTAAIIADSLNKYYKTMGKEITSEYLMETELDLVKKEIKAEMEYLSSIVELGNVEVKLLNPSFDKLMNLIDQWGLKKEKVDLLLLRGEFYYYSYQYNNAINDYSDALVYYIEEKNHSEIARLYNLIGTSYYMLMLIDKAITYYTKSYETAIEQNIANKDTIKIESIFNLTLCYKKMQKYDITLQYVTMFKELENNQDCYAFYYDQTVLVEANTYRDLRIYEKAEKIYEKLLQRKTELNINTLFLVYENYSTFYRDQKKIHKAVYYINKALEFKEDVMPVYCSMGIMGLAKCQMLLGNFSEAIETLSEGLTLAKDNLRNEMIIDFLFTLIQVYIQLKDYDNALNNLQEVEKIIIEKDIKAKINDLHSFYAEVYLELNEKGKCLEYMMKNRQDYLAI